MLWAALLPEPWALDTLGVALHLEKPARVDAGASHRRSGRSSRATAPWSFLSPGKRPGPDCQSTALARQRSFGGLTRKRPFEDRPRALTNRAALAPPVRLHRLLVRGRNLRGGVN